MSAQIDEEAYAEELLAILTRPDPSDVAAADPADPYALEDDGIDRHDGFGEEVWVESVEVEQGEHGAELVVGFGLTRDTADELALVPPQGSLRLPFDAEWREQSGYAEPAAYAPIVSARVMAAARHHVEEGLAAAVPEPPQPEASVLEPTEQHELLLDALARWGRPHDVGPGRIELRHPHSPLVTVLVTPGEWTRWVEDLTPDEVSARVDERMVGRHEDETFVVFHDGDLHPSTREELPPARGQAWERRVAEVAQDTEGP